MTNRPAKDLSYSPLTMARSAPANPINHGELLSYPSSPTASEADKDWMEEEEWLLGSADNEERYGTNNDHTNEAAQARERLMHRKKRRKRAGHRMESTTVASITSITKLFGNESSDEEQPPVIEMIYRRSKKDLFKLITIPLLYILLMGVAVVYAFYTITGLTESYAKKVRSIQVINVGDRFEPIGIAVFPQFSSFNHCEYRYYDDLSPHPHTPPQSCKGFEIPFTCTMENLTFVSTDLKVNRTALVFEGPTLVACKESVLLRFSMNTSVREFSAIEYVLFKDYARFRNLGIEEKQGFLANLEASHSIYTFPAGFRTWVKLAYSIRVNSENRKITDFTIEDNYAAYNDNPVEGMFPMEVLFEWKSNTYEYIEEIVSTTAWSAFGSLCGVFITLVKAGEFCRMWLRRIRRDRQKKVEHLERLQVEQNRLMDEYNKKQEVKRESRMKRSLEISKAIGTGIRVE